MTANYKNISAFSNNRYYYHFDRRDARAQCVQNSTPFNQSNISKLSFFEWGARTDVTGTNTLLFYPYDSCFIINISFYPQSAFSPGLQSAVCGLHFTLTDFQSLVKNVPRQQKQQITVSLLLIPQIFWFS